jgi:hypothetical protein
MEYFEVDEQGLTWLMRGLGMLERLDAEKASEFRVCLYCLTSDPAILARAKEIILESQEEYWDEQGNTVLSPENVALAEIAITAPLSSDGIDAFLSGNFTLGNDCEFAYLPPGGEGVVSRSFYGYAGWSRPTLGPRQARNLALANDDIHLRDYFMKHGSGRRMEILPPGGKPPRVPTVPSVKASRDQEKADVRDAVEELLG